jgi:dTDP-4-amino-4,6-dideoxygalactose transaminase
MLGFNYRLTEMQAVLEIRYMNRFEDFLKRRKECDEYLKDKVLKIDGINSQKVTLGVEPSNCYFSVTLDIDK